MSGFTDKSQCSERRYSEEGKELRSVGTHLRKMRWHSGDSEHRKSAHGAVICNTKRSSFSGHEIIRYPLSMGTGLCYNGFYVNL